MRYVVVAQRYVLEFQGQLELEWADWFENPSITYTDNGRTILTGLVADQAALHGLLAKLGSLGVPILLLVCLGNPAADL